jgi:hypothetical protein
MLWYIVAGVFLLWLLDELMSKFLRYGENRWGVPRPPKEKLVLLAGLKIRQTRAGRAQVAPRRSGTCAARDLINSRLYCRFFNILNYSTSPRT